MLYRSILRPLLFHLPPETAHQLALKSLSIALGPSWIHEQVRRRNLRQPFGELLRFGVTFPNPIGLAAGFDKNGVAVDQFSSLGFGFVEVGTVTHLPQPGNPRPRLFRLSKDHALINRQGFNNHGADALANRLNEHHPNCLLGINIGKSRIVELEDATADYLATFELVFPHADYVVVNVSSPNTPNLRELQRANPLEALLLALQKRNNELSQQQRRKSVPLLVKIAPDLSADELEEIVDVAQRAHLSGIVATNTTTSRDGLQTSKSIVDTCGEGGLSGAPLRERSNEIISTLYRLTRGKMTIIGVGGVFSAVDAWEKICAGASLVQLYTGFIYQGWNIARDINEGLSEILRNSGIKSLDEAVGIRSRENDKVRIG